MSQKKRIKTIFIAILSLFSLMAIGLFVLFGLVYTGAFGPLPNSDILSGINNEEASLVYSSEGELIGKYFAKNRTNIKWEEIPDHLKYALIATEDKRFFTHEGFDVRSYLRVLFRSIILRDRSGGGGSTLTQQLIKNLYGRTDNGLLTIPVNKIKEAIIATRMEKVYSKEELLLLYLNSVPFGEDVYGVESAAHRYFNKSVSNLNVEESAVLIGMLKANTYFNPRMHPEHSIGRRNVVLTLMQNENYLTKVQCDSLKQLPLNLHYENLKLKAPAGYFVYQVKREVKDLLVNVVKKSGEPYDIEKDGLQIYTTLNFKMQQIASDAVRTHLKKMQSLLDHDLKQSKQKSQWIRALEKDSLLGKADFKVRPVELFDWDSISSVKLSRVDSLWHYEKMLNGAVLATDPTTGAVLCWIGGNNYRYLPFDMVLSHRQIASAFKPILYAAAFGKGFNPCSYLENTEVEYEEWNNWRPQNFDLESTPDSLVAAWYALAHSMNVPTVDLYFKTGWEQLVTICNKLGLPVLTTENPSVALGTVDVSLYEIVRAYSVFASQGYFSDLYTVEKITDAGGKTIYDKNTSEQQEVLDSLTCQQITAILQRAVNEGTGTRLRWQFNIKAELAGKTGTAQNYSNAWFMTYTPNMVVGTWVGNRSPGIHFSSAYGTGSSLALPIAGRLLQKMELDPGLHERYFTNYTFGTDSVGIVCDAYKAKGVKGIIDRLFGTDKKETIGKEKPEEEKGLKGLFRKLFKKKRKN